MSKSKADQLLFRVNSQKDKSAVINRVTLLVRLRFKHYSKTRRKKKVKGKTRTKDGGGKNKAADTKDNGAKNAGRKGRGRKKGGSKRKKNNSKSRRKKSRRVKILVQARTDRKGKFRRVVVQRVSVSKKFNWIKVPIPVSYVSRAAQSANHSLVLRVRCKRCSKSGVSIDNALPRKKSQKSDVDGSAFLNLNPNRPYMVICTADSPLTTLAPAPAPLPRSARHVDKVCPSQSQPEFSCCAEHVEVTFEDLGWDYWIVHPKGFTTVICGVCQTASNDQDMEFDENDVSSSKRKLTQQEQKSLFSGQRLGDESAKDSDDDDSRVIDERQLEMCHPKERSSLTLMYYRDHNTLVRTTIPQLLTRSCACSLSH